MIRLFTIVGITAALGAGSLVPVAEAADAKSQAHAQDLLNSARGFYQKGSTSRLPAMRSRPARTSKARRLKPKLIPG